MLYLSQKLLEATVLGPKIIGPHVGLHPVLLIMSLILFEYFMGFVGLLIAVPVGAVMMAAAQAWSDSQPPKIIIPERDIMPVLGFRQTLRRLRALLRRSVSSLFRYPNQISDIGYRIFI